MQDIRHAIRVLLKSPNTTAVMVLILGVGIGANTAIFSFVNALFLKPLAVADPEIVVKIFAKGPHGHHGAGFSYPEYVSVRDNSTSFSALAAETHIAQVHAIFAGDSAELRGAFVSANYFSTLGVKPELGRFFLREEDTVPDRDAVAVIASELWRRRFNSDPAVIGRTININRIPFQIVGVAPAGFTGAHAGNPEQLWVPLMMLHAARYFGSCPHAYDCSVIDNLVGRLAPEHRRRDAEDELSRIIVWSATDWPASAGRRQIVTFPATGVDPDDRADFSKQMRLLMCVAVVLLLVSCANLAGLFLARSLSRGKEIAVRLAIGASRYRVARELVTECMLLAALSCGVGLGFSVWGRNLLAGFYNVDSEGFRHLYDLRLDWRVLLFSCAAAIFTGLLFGLLPAIRATRQDLIVQLKDGAGAAGSQRSGWLRQALVAGQVALSLVLLVAAGLLMRSSQALRRGTNFDPDHVALLRVRPELVNYSPRQNEQFFTRVIERLQALPGVQAVTCVRGGEGLIWEWDSGRDVQVNTPGSSTVPLDVLHHDIGLNFFSALRIPLVAGRDFTEQDNAKAPLVAIINQTFARQLWHGDSAVGRSIIVSGRPAQVVGVAADIQPPNSTVPPSPYLFLPFWQSNPGKEGDMRIAVRVQADPDAALAEIRQAVQAIDPNIPIGEDMSMVRQIETQYMSVMLSRTVIAFAGVIALCLSAIGLFSVLTYYVRTRTREIGIRMALGAQITSVLQLIIGQGMAMSLTGVAAGLLLAIGITRLLAAWLYGVRSMDAMTFAAAAALLFAVAIAASYLPARRAAEVDPIIALRQE